MRELTRADFGVGPDEPFDLAQANRVYRWAMAVPEPIAKMVTEQMAWEHDARHADEVAAHARATVAKRLAEVRPGLAKMAVSKRHDPALEVVQKAAEIVQAWLDDVSKAQRRVATPEGEQFYGQPIGSVIEGERFSPGGKPRRGSTKRPGITRMQRAFQVDPNTDIAPEELSHIGSGWQRGERAGMQGLDPQQSAAFQRAWRQTALQLHNAQMEAGPGVAQARLVWGDRVDDKGKTVPVDPSTTPVLLSSSNLVGEGMTPQAANEIRQGRQLLGVELITSDLTDPGMGVASRLGVDPGDFNTARGAVKESARSVSGEKQWDLKGVTAPRYTEPSARRPNAGKYNAASRTAGAAGDLITPYNPGAGTALKAGAYAGRYGQNVEDMIGPTVERMAFRYRAVEKAPPAGLQAQLDGLRTRAQRNRGTARDGRTLAPGRQAHLDFTLGWHSASAERQARAAGAKVTIDGQTLPAGSPLRQHLTNKLPDAALLDLHQKAGRATPSEGIIINRSGDIVTESVGEGSDWYLPFTAKRLKDMDGGFYGRTRLWGGPTPEDISTALANNARGFMVQSRHGTYYVEFSDDFRGLRRRNDKTARMSKDYEDLLDAIRGGQVTPAIPPERMAEISRTAEAMGGLDQQKVKAAQKRLIAEERRNPQLPTSTKTAVAEQILAGYAASEIQTTGDEYPLDQAKTDILTDYGTERREHYEARGFGPQESAERAMMDVRGKADDAVWMVGRNPDLKRRYDRQVEAATRDAQRELAATRLNGEGYAKALRALQEIYPYYFSSIEYRPGVFKESEEGASGPDQPDGYYTRPGDTRPVDATIGLFEAPNSNRSGPISAGDRWSRNPASRTPAKTQTEEAERPTQGQQERLTPPDGKETYRDVLRLREALTDPRTQQPFKGLVGQGAVANTLMTGNPADPNFAQNAMAEVRVLEQSGRLQGAPAEALRSVKLSLTQATAAEAEKQARQAGVERPKSTTSDTFTKDLMRLVDQEANATAVGTMSQRVKPAQMDQIVDDTLVDLPRLRWDAYKPQAPREALQEEYGRILTDIAEVAGFDAVKRLPDVQEVGQEMATDAIETAARQAMVRAAEKSGDLLPGASQQQQSERRDAQAKQNSLIVSLMRARYVTSKAETARPAEQVVRQKPKRLSEAEQEAERDARMAAGERPQPSPEATRQAQASAGEAAGAIPLDTLLREGPKAAYTVPPPQRTSPTLRVLDEVVDQDEGLKLGQIIMNDPSFAALSRAANGQEPKEGDATPEDAIADLQTQYGDRPEVMAAIEELLTRTSAGKENKVKRIRRKQ